MRSALPPGLLRPELPGLPAFSVSEQPHRAKLDQNESVCDLPGPLKDRVLAELRGEAWHRYPQPRRYVEAKERFAAAIGQPAERVVLTAGCDQMILLAYWAAGGPGRQARVFEPTYPMFGHFALVTQTSCERVVLGADFDVRAHGLGSRTDLLFLVSPNNPTGDGPDRELVVEALGRHGLVFLDEAYADYAGSSLIDLVSEAPNLLVGRSLSKSLLAGLRVGYGVGHPEVVAVLERLLFAPYHLNLLQLLVAEHFHEVQPLLAKQVRQVRAERERLRGELGRLGLRTWPSRANFILFEVPDPRAVHAGLLRAGVRIRDVSAMPGLERHLRVTVGSAEENQLFLSALRASL